MQIDYWHPTNLDLCTFSIRGLTTYWSIHLLNSKKMHGLICVQLRIGSTLMRVESQMRWFLQYEEKQLIEQKWNKTILANEFSICIPSQSPTLKSWIVKNREWTRVRKFQQVTMERPFSDILSASCQFSNNYAIGLSCEGLAIF